MAEPIDVHVAEPVGGCRPAGRARNWRLPNTAWSVVALRRQLRSFLGACRLPAADLEDLVLAACEAATNGIEHARYPSEPFFDVQAEIDDTLVRVVVRDYGRWTPGGPDGAGLGLHLMTGLTAVSVTSGPGGTSVTLSAVVDGGQR